MASQTVRRWRGNRAEEIVADRLSAAGWRVLARQVHIGRDEIDIVALDRDPPATLVAVEVRSATSGRFGAPEERVDARKVGRVYRAVRALRAEGTLPDGSRLPRLAWRIDVVLVEMRPWLAPGIGGPLVPHLRGVHPDWGFHRSSPRHSIRCKPP